MTRTHSYSFFADLHNSYAQGFEECKSAIGNRSIENGAQLVRIFSVKEAVFE